MMSLGERIDAILKAENLKFTELVEISGLNPKTDFRYLNLRNVDFSNCDLSEYDLTGADITGAVFKNTKISQTIFDEEQKEYTGLNLAQDFELFSDKNNINTSSGLSTFLKFKSYFKISLSGTDNDIKKELGFFLRDLRSTGLERQKFLERALISAGFQDKILPELAHKNFCAGNGDEDVFWAFYFYLHNILPDDERLKNIDKKALNGKTFRDVSGLSVRELKEQDGRFKLISPQLTPRISDKEPEPQKSKISDIDFDALILASENGDVEEIFKLLGYTNSKNILPSDKRYTPLIIASLYNDFNMVAQLLKHPSILINQAIDNGSTALMFACRAGHPDVVALLLEHPDIIINQATNTGFTALMIACHKGYPDVVALLLAHPDITINQAMNNGFTALMGACWIGRPDVAALLLEHPDTKINQLDATGNTALDHAETENHTEIAQLLIKAGAKRGSELRGDASGSE